MSDEKPTPIDERINCSFEEIRPEYPAILSQAKDDVDDDTGKMIRFLCLVGRLKSQPRRGWILKDRNIPNCESISGHMYRMAIMAMLFDDADTDTDVIKNGAQNGIKLDSAANGAKLDVDKMIRMTLLHDMAECVVGDITPFDGISPEEKHAKELDTMKKLEALLPRKVGEKMLQLYKEYESHESREACLVKELDRYDFCQQAFQYEMQEYHNSGRQNLMFDECFSLAIANVKHPMLRRMVERLVQQREQFWAEKKSTNGRNGGDHI